MDHRHDPNEVWLTSREVADGLRLTVATLDKWVYHGSGPAYIKAPGVRRYPLSAVEKWEEDLRAEAEVRRRLRVDHDPHRASQRLTRTQPPK